MKRLSKFGGKAPCEVNFVDAGRLVVGTSVFCDTAWAAG